MVGKRVARAFAGLVGNCDRFVACDSGAVRLACALGICTVATFLENIFTHWSPPAPLAQIVYHEQGAAVDIVARACREEMALLSQTDPAAAGSAAIDAKTIAAARG